LQHTTYILLYSFANIAWVFKTQKNFTSVPLPVKDEWSIYHVIIMQCPEKSWPGYFTCLVQVSSLKYGFSFVSCYFLQFHLHFTMNEGAGKKIKP